MSFLYRKNEATANSAPSLSQHGRAGMEVLGSLQKFSSGTLRSKARADFEADPDAKALCHAWERKETNRSIPSYISEAKEVAHLLGSYRHERFLQRFVAEEVYIRGVPTVEEQRPVFEAGRAMPADPIGSLETDPGLKMPDYFDGVEWHLEPGGWDGYDLYGSLFTDVAGPYIFQYGGYAAVEPGEDIVKHRLDVLGQLPKPKYDRIYDFGCGGISAAAALHKLHPEAELVGCDLSELLLTNGHIHAERRGIPVALKQRDCRYTGEPDESFDAVVLYAVLHEMPREVGIESLKEAYRILKPGGDILVSDPPPFREVGLLQSVLLDWDTTYREEPYFSEACMADWPTELEKVGFEDARDRALGPHGYPWVTLARKPEARK